MDLLNSIIKNSMGSFDRFKNREPFKRVFPNAKVFNSDKWVSIMEEGSLDFEPIKATIIPGEYGNCILIIYCNKYDNQDGDIYLQWTYQYKGCLLTEYYVVEESEV